MTTDLVLSGSADASIKVWDPHVGVTQGPQCTQTLVGHGGSVTALVHKAAYIISGSTDRSIRLWRAVEGRRLMAYPWFEPQAVLVLAEGWIHSLSFAASSKVGDQGTLYAADSTGAVLKVVPHVLESPPVWRPMSRVDWRVEGQAEPKGGGPPLAFRRVCDRGFLAVRYLADEGLVVTLSYDCCMRVFDVHAGGCRYVVENENGCQFTSLEYDPEHAQVVLADKRGYLWLWDLRRQCMAASKRLATDAIVAVFKSRVAGEFGVCYAQLLEFWRIERDLDYNIVRGGHTGPVVSLYAVPGRQVGQGGLDFRVLSASQDNSIRVWDPERMQCLRLLRETRSEISVMTFYEQGNMPITGHDDGTIRLWTLDTGSTINMREHTNTVSCLAMVAVSKQDELLFSAGFDGWVCVWNVRKRSHTSRPELLYHWEAHPSSEVLCLRHNPLKNVILTAGNDRRIKVWNARTYDYMGEHVGHSEAVACLALDANFLFSGSEDCSIRVWDTVPAAGQGKRQAKLPFSGGTHLKTLTGHKQTVTAIEVLPLSGHLVSCGTDGQLLIWDYTAAVVLRRFQRPDEFRCLALRHDADEVLVGTMQNAIYRFAAGEAVRLG
ncbi:hypothetical protein WJX72_010761 [[Myrmecia] bisecta]|uniref:Uncharacterized protein n=1 Tax=[Myrmecia] bisecta TaxID=41462 RepID=A0AAW1P6I3_9CHLO